MSGSNEKSASRGEPTATQRNLHRHAHRYRPPPSSAPLQDELDSLRREKLDLHSQLFEAGQIQRKLSGSRELRHGCLQFASEVFAARFLSGDFTMFLQHGSRVLTAHGDIAGKGIAAGMWFTNLAGLLQSYGHPDSDPAEIASEVNRHLCYLRPVAPFVTAFLAQIDCHLGTLTYCNAGHFPPILLRADGRTERLKRVARCWARLSVRNSAQASWFLIPATRLSHIPMAYSNAATLPEKSLDWNDC